MALIQETCILNGQLNIFRKFTRECQNMWGRVVREKSFTHNIGATNTNLTLKLVLVF